MAILIDHRKIPRFRIIKRLHDLIHRRVDYDLGRAETMNFDTWKRLYNSGRNMIFRILSSKTIPSNTPRSSTTGKVLRPLREMTFTISPNVISGDTIWKSFSITLSARSRGKHRPILMVRQQLAFLRQTHGVDAMRLEHKDRDIGTDRDDHQGRNKSYPPVSSAIKKTPVKGGASPRT